MYKQPEQTAQTKKRLLDAFWTVAQKRGLSGATISEIARVAGVNRGTFYVYFKDMEDILEQAEQEIVDVFRRNLEETAAQTNPYDFRALTAGVVGIMEQYGDKLFLLLGKDGDPEFLYRIRRAALVIFPSLLKTDAEDPYLDYVIVFITSAFAGLIQFWHETGKELSVQELTSFAHTLALQGVAGLVALQ